MAARTHEIKLKVELTRMWKFWITLGCIVTFGETPKWAINRAVKIKVVS